jgi:hypothetical protein
MAFVLHSDNILYMGQLIVLWIRVRAWISNGHVPF